MFSGQHNIPKQHYRIETHPTIEQLKHFLHQAQSQRGVKHCYYWSSELKRSLFILTVHHARNSADPEWWMHQDTPQGPRMLWFYRTSDLAVLFPQILAAVGTSVISQGADADESHKTTLNERLAHMTGTNLIPVNVGQTGGPTQVPLHKQMSGNLGNSPLSHLLEIAAKNDATGRLLVENGQLGIVQFIHGRPVHATTSTSTGLEALLELYTLIDGNVSFSTGTTPDTTSINQSVEQIQYLGAQLIEDIGFLQEHGIDEKSVLLRSIPNIDVRELERRILDGPPLGLDLQKLFFQNLDGQRSLKEVANFLSLKESSWISVTANLLRLGLLLTPTGHMLEFVSQSQSLAGPMQARPLNQAAVSHPTAPITSLPVPANLTQSNPARQPQSEPGGSPWGTARTDTVNKPLLPPTSAFGGQSTAALVDASASPSVAAFVTSAIVGDVVVSKHIGVPSQEVAFELSRGKRIQNALLNEDTGVYTFDAMHFFLIEEYKRAFRFSKPFALVAFCLKPTAGNPSNQSTEVVAMVLNAVGKLKNDVDILGHLGDKAYGIIVPNATTNDATALVDLICAGLTSAAPELGIRKPSLHFGIASVPGDVREVKVLVSVCQQAMIKAVSTNVTRVRYEG